MSQDNQHVETMNQSELGDTMVLDAGIPKTVDNTLLNESQEVSTIGYQPHIINSA